MNDRKKVVLSLDVGGSKFIVGLVDFESKIVVSKREEWNTQDGTQIINYLTTKMEQLIANHCSYEIVAIGITIPGIADVKNGIWVNGFLGGIHHFPIVKYFNDIFNLPVFIENDANACAYGEKYFGSCKDCENFMYITVSSGVGGALFLNGMLYLGNHGGAGEIGITVMDEKGRTNNDGETGLLELYASTSGMAQTYIELGGSNIDNGALDGKTIFDLARQGDVIATKTVELEGHYLGLAISNANNLLDLQRFVIGGGISLGFDLFAPYMQETLKIHNHQTNPTFSVVPTNLGYNGAFIGAATIALLGSGMISP